MHPYICHPLVARFRTFLVAFSLLLWQELWLYLVSFCFSSHRCVSLTIYLSLFFHDRCSNTWPDHAIPGWPILLTSYCGNIASSFGNVVSPFCSFTFLINVVKRAAVCSSWYLHAIFKSWRVQKGFLPHFTFTKKFLGKFSRLQFTKS